MVLAAYESAYIDLLHRVSMECHDLTTLKAAHDDLRVTDEVVDIVRQLLVNNSEKSKYLLNIKKVDIL